jgi:hypothetical protein
MSETKELEKVYKVNCINRDLSLTKAIFKTEEGCVINYTKVDKELLENYPKSTEKSLDIILFVPTMIRSENLISNEHGPVELVDPISLCRLVEQNPFIYKDRLIATLWKDEKGVISYLIFGSTTSQKILVSLQRTRPTAGKTLTFAVIKNKSN